MYFKKTFLIALMALCLPFINCGEKTNEPVSLNGRVLIDQNLDYFSSNITGALFVAVSKTMDYDAINKAPLDTIVDLSLTEYAGGNSYTFSTDLTESGVQPGDQVYIFAFIDVGYRGGIPNIKPGDILGFYIDSDNLDMAYTLNKGNQNFVEIDLCRVVYDFDASITGRILTHEPGNIILVAYAGEIDSFNFNNININDIIGYKKITSTTGSVPYTLDILPYGHNVPINNVYVFAFLDKNKNGRPDTGDFWGTAYDDDGYPLTVTIEDGSLINLDLVVDHEMGGASGQTIILKGNLTMPVEYGPDSPPVFMIVSQSDSPDEIFENTLDTVKYFEKLPRGATSFDLDISGSGLMSGDRVMVIALWDRDHVSGFPRLSEGDMIGYYIDQTDYSYQYTLAEGNNEGVNIKVDKSYKENNATVQGTIIDSTGGDVIIVAYTGVVESFDVNLNADYIIGFEKMTKGPLPADYTMDILPFAQFPLEDVYIFAFIDYNGNGMPDSGDRWGSYVDGDGYPMTITLIDGATTGIDIELDHIISEPSGYHMSLQGSFTPPAGYNASSPPVFMIVCDADDPEQIFSNTMSTVKHFVKLPAGSSVFDIDLSSTDLIPGDRVMIIALWDRDYISGFPGLSEGDMIGYYINDEDYSYQHELIDGVNSGITLNLCHTYHENNASVTGTILGDESGDVIIIAYTGEFTSLDMELDTDKVVGYKKMAKGAAPVTYTMDLLPFVTFPVQNAFIFAILDVNGNGVPDNGDRLGFYSAAGNGIPSVVNLANGVNSGLNIEFLMNYVEPSTGGTPMTLSGAITAPSGYTSNPASKPIFIIIATADNTFELFDNPMATMKYFVRLPQGATTYNIDLTGTGLEPGDEIRILALWDLNYTAGFPSPDAGDKIGYYQKKSDFTFSKVLTAGANYANLTGGWSFGINKTLYDHNARLSFKFNQNVGAERLRESRIRGRDVIVVTIHQNGVDDNWSFWNMLNPPSYGITDMDYITTIDYITIPNVSNWQDYTYTVGFFPFIYDSIPRSTNPLRISNMYVYVILDDNGNGWPDTGEYLGFYWTWLIWPSVTTPQKTTIYYDRTNTLPSGEVVTFTTRTY